MTRRGPATIVLTLVAVAFLAVGPFDSPVQLRLRSMDTNLFGVSSHPHRAALSALKWLSSLDGQSVAIETPRVTDTVAPPAELPPGIDHQFISTLARECPAVNERELLSIVQTTWQVCQEEKFHFMRALAQMRAESDFNPRLVSSAGARGLMQIIPRTATFMGFADIDDIEANIRCGVRYMKWLERFTDRHEARERWLATLASYNSGPGRYTEMVRRTKRRYGTDDWAFVAKTYRRRFRRAAGHRLPETLIYIRRNLDTLQRFHAEFFEASSLTLDNLSTIVRLPREGQHEITTTD